MAETVKIVIEIKGGDVTISVEQTPAQSASQSIARSLAKLALATEASETQPPAPKLAEKPPERVLSVSPEDLARLHPPARPEEIARYTPLSPDEGQHDIWKREMALAICRYLMPSHPWQRDWFDVGPPGDMAVGPVLPLSTDLAGACRRLGFMRLVVAALGLDVSPSGPGIYAVWRAPLSPVQVWPAGGGFSALKTSDTLTPQLIAEGLARAHKEAVEAEQQRVQARLEASRSSWDERRGSFEDAASSAASSSRLLDLAPDPEADPIYRPDLDAAPPLSPLRLRHQPTLPRTPATGVVLPPPS